MSSLSSSSTNHEIFIYDKAEEEAVNGFVAGLAGSALHDESDVNLSGITSKKRTIRLSANSGSYEESDYRISQHPSITEEVTSDSDIRLDDQDSELFEMRVSNDSHYPERFSLLNLSEVSKEDPEATLEDTNCSTIDASLNHNTLEVVIDQDREGEEESMDSVFSPGHSSSFGDFQKKKESRCGSDSSIDSFGDFDDSGPWVAPPAETNTEVTSSEEITSFVTSSEDLPRDLIAPATEQCYEPLSPTSLILHSSPKKLLENNFVWSQARSNVTKPSYTWDKLKLHSYLLGALSVRQPISLNRLKPAGLVTTPKKLSSKSGSVSVTSSSPHSSNSTPDSPVSSVSPSEVSSVSPSEVSSVSPSEVELGELPGAEDSLSEVEGWNSNVSSPDIPSMSIEHNSRPSFTSRIQQKLTSHRRTHSLPMPVVQPVSPGTRSLTSSPSTAIRTITKSNSLESPLSPSSFDETHAGRGLSLLQLPDIQTMRHEMKSRVSELSATLIKEFQYRGDADHSKEVKKAFVSAFLAAEEKKSKGQLSSRQKNLLPIFCNEEIPPTEILVLLTQLLNGFLNDSPHTAELLKHYMYMLCRPCLDN